MSGQRLARRLLALALMAAVLVGATPPASAGTRPGRLLDGAVSGPVTGTTTFEFESATCFVRQVFEGSFEPETGHGTGSFAVDGCIDPFSGPFPSIAGTFLVVAADGSQLSGTVAGTLETAENPYTNGTFTLAVTEGTRRFRRTTGTLALDFAWEATPGGPGQVNPITGDLDASLTRPGRK